MFPRQMRRDIMSFVCKCVACQNDYPMLILMRAGTIPKQLLDKALKAEYYYNRKEALADQGMVAKYLQDRDREYPTRALCLVSIYYRHINELMYCKEIPLCARFRQIDNAEIAARVGIISKTFFNKH